MTESCLEECIIHHTYVPVWTNFPRATINNVLPFEPSMIRNKTATGKRPITSLLYHPSTNRVRTIIQSNWSLLQSRAELAMMVSQPPLIAYKRDTNIRDILVRSKLRQPVTRTPGTTPCNQAKCGTSFHLHQHQRYWP